MKSSTMDNNGLLHKLSICLSLVNKIGQTKAIAQLWKEFLLELRFRYESSILIPGVTDASQSKQNNQESGFIAPDLSRCLLHQKIQMLNCCIKKKLERQELEKNSNKQRVEDKSSKKNESEEEDDQFFDCEDEETQITPEGRLKKFGDLTLLNKPNEPIYVPITQVSNN